MLLHSCLLFLQLPTSRLCVKPSCLSQESPGHQRDSREVTGSYPGHPLCQVISGRKHKGLPRPMGLGLIHSKVLPWLDSHWAQGLTFHLSFQPIHPAAPPRSQAGGLCKQSHPPTTIVNNLQDSCSLSMVLFPPLAIQKFSLDPPGNTIYSCSFIPVQDLDNQPKQAKPYCLHLFPEYLHVMSRGSTEGYQSC